MFASPTPPLPSAGDGPELAEPSLAPGMTGMTEGPAVVPAMPTEMPTDAPEDVPPPTEEEPVDTHRCGWGEPVDPRDAMIEEDYEVWSGSLGVVDLVLPDPIIAWMDERIWDGSHNLWHSVRQCEATAGRPRLGPPRMALCDERPALVAENQNCENPRDGYEFLVMHRHMIEALREAFPEHRRLFEGFPSFPLSAEDVPEPLRAGWGRGWSAEVTETAAMLDNIEDHLDRFPTEGELGMYIQCGAMSDGMTGVHGALHFKWAEFASPRNLGDQSKNLGNYMFWKLHGWIDDVWQRYRVARGLDQDPNDMLAQELEDQCWEMHDLGHVAMQELGVGPVDLPDESGTFHDLIRPILDDNCSSCHSGPTPSGGLVLGGAVSSADLVASLVDQPAARGGSFVLVAPGAPDRSWLYLRAADLARTAGCQGSCSTGVMPPTGDVTLTDGQLDTLAQWIKDGATGP